jgi:hypothetical protein
MIGLYIISAFILGAIIIASLIAHIIIKPMPWVSPPGL